MTTKKCKNCPNDVGTIPRLFFYKEVVNRGILNGLPVADLELKTRQVDDLCQDCFNEYQRTEFAKADIYKK